MKLQIGVKLGINSREHMRVNVLGSIEYMIVICNMFARYAIWENSDPILFVVGRGSFRSSISPKIAQLAN